MREVLERHGGIVEKYIGDAIMAVFGLPRVHEDDALRAVRAASEMGRTLSSLNIELERLWGVSLSNRTGINTGEVVVGDAASGQRLATGDAVNVAARLEQKAPVGQVLIGPLTHRLIKDAVIVEAVEPLVLKGKSEAMPAFRVIEVDQVPGVTRRVETPLVGRDEELTSLMGAFGRSLEERRCHVVTVFGDVGVGKSRLVAEAVEHLHTRAQIVRGRCFSYGEGITFWPLAEVMREAGGITEDDSRAAARAKLASLLEAVEDGDAISERVASVMGLASTPYALEETFWATRRALEALARVRPLVVVFEDIHWAEPTFLDLVEHVVELSTEAPILIICAARRELLEGRPEWMQATPNASAISLEALSTLDADLLLDNLLGKSGLEGRAQARITDPAQGNPLFVEQIVYMLRDDGTLHHENGQWRISGDSSSVAIPPTISALLSARLDRLTSEERTVIASASVVGQVFYLGAVEDLCPPVVRSNVRPSLLALEAKQFVRPDPSMFADEQAYAFRHVLVRDAAYHAMLKRRRAELHERFASWLERVAGERVSEYDEVVGYHLEQAYLLLRALGNVDDDALRTAERAAHYLSSAGVRAFDRGDLPAAAALLTRSIEITTNEARRQPLLTMLGEVLSSCGHFAGAEEHLNEALASAMKLDDEGAATHARLALLELRGQTHPVGITKEAEKQARHAIEQFSAVGDELGLSKAWATLGDVFFNTGKVAQAESACKQAIVHARKAGARRLWLGNLVYWAAMAIYGPHPVRSAFRRCHEVLIDLRGEMSFEVDLHGLLAILHAMDGNHERARDAIRKSKAIAEDLALEYAWLRCLERSAMVEELAGNPVAAERELRAQYEALTALGEQGVLSTTAANLAHALCGQERYEEAAPLAAQSRDVADETDVASQTLWRTAMAKILAARAQPDDAMKLTNEALSKIGQTDWLNERARALCDSSLVSEMCGHRDEATRTIRRALHLYEQKGNIVSAAKARDQLEELKGAPSPSR